MIARKAPGLVCTGPGDPAAKNGIMRAKISFSSMDGLAQQCVQMRKAASRLLGRTAFDRKHAIETGILQNADHPTPVDYSVAASAADRCSGYLAAFGIRMLDRDVLGMNMDHPVGHAAQSLIRVLAAEIGVAGVIVYPQAR